MESAAKPNYSRDSWTIQSVLSSSWEKQKGAKGIILLACLIYMVITTIVELSYGALLISLDVIEYGDQWDNVTWSVQLVGFFVNVLESPLLYGLLLLGIQRSAGIPIHVKTIFQPFRFFFLLVSLTLLSSLFTVAGFLLLVLPGIYLALAYAFSPYLMIKKNMGIWESMETSRKTVTEYWWRYFGLMLLLVLLNIVAAVALLVPLVWTIPMTFIAIGEVYNASFEKNNEGSDTNSNPAYAAPKL